MEIQIIRSNRKTAAIQVWQNQTVKVRVPRSMPEKEIQRIIKEKEPWIRTNLEKMKKRQEQLQEAERNTVHLTGAELQMRHIRPDHDPLPENPLGKLQRQRQSELQLPAHAGPAGGSELCGRS